MDFNWIQLLNHYIFVELIFDNWDLQALYRKMNQINIQLQPFWSSPSYKLS